VTPNDLARTAALHDALGRWAADHARRYPAIGLLDYDPETHPEQRIETFKSPIRARRSPSSPSDIGSDLRTKLETTMGSAATRALAALYQPEGTDGLAPRDILASHVEAGKNVAILVCHAGGFEDMGVFPGAMAVSLEKADLIARNGVILNKVMTRETYKGHSIRDLFLLFANIYWVLPPGTNMLRWDVDQGLARYVNLTALRTIISDMSTGLLLTFAPSGSAMIESYDHAGNLTSLHIPPVARGTANLISRFDAYMCGASWRDHVALGPLRPLPISREGSGAPPIPNQTALLDAVLAEMARLTEDLSGVPVTHDAALNAERVI
jgi:hypothetical protein